MSTPTMTFIEQIEKHAPRDAKGRPLVMDGNGKTHTILATDGPSPNVIIAMTRRYLANGQWLSHQGKDGLSAPFQWTLGRSVNGFTLGEGQEWHRIDWTQNMLPDGTRPLLLGEGGAKPNDFHQRTTSPLPAITDPYAALKSKLKKGRTIQFDLGHEWEDRTTPEDGEWPEEWDAHPRFYRVKPEPVMVELEPSDIPPGSALRWDGNKTWRLVTGTSDLGVKTNLGEESFSSLKRKGRSHPPPRHAHPRRQAALGEVREGVQMSEERKAAYATISAALFMGQIPSGHRAWLDAQDDEMVIGIANDCQPKETPTKEAK